MERLRGRLAWGVTSDKVSSNKTRVWFFSEFFCSTSSGSVLFSETLPYCSKTSHTNSHFHVQWEEWTSFLSASHNPWDLLWLSYPGSCVHLCTRPGVTVGRRMPKTHLFMLLSHASETPSQEVSWGDPQWDYLGDWLLKSQLQQKMQGCSHVYSSERGWLKVLKSISSLLFDSLFFPSQTTGHQYFWWLF